MSLQQSIIDALSDYPGGATIDVIHEELEDRGYITFHDQDRVTDTTNKMALSGKLFRSGKRRTYVFKITEAS